MLASYRVHEISSRDALTPGLSVLRTKVFRSLIACKTFYHQTCAKTSPILLFWPCSMTASHSKTVSQEIMQMTGFKSRNTFYKYVVNAERQCWSVLTISSLAEPPRYDKQLSKNYDTEFCNLQKTKKRREFQFGRNAYFSVCHTIRSRGPSWDFDFMYS